MKKTNKNLTTGDIKKQLLRLTWPMLMGMVGMVVFHLVDTYFIGKLGVHQLAAIGFAFPVVMFINGLSQGIGIGTSSLISRNIIIEHRDNVKMMASRALLMGVIIVLIFVVAGILTIEPLFRALGATHEVLGYIKDYMWIWYLGVPFVIVPMVGNNIVRATGDTFTPGMLMVASAVINVILDPLLIFGLGPFPEMGIKGAALSTVIARGVSLSIILFVLIHREKLLTLYFGRVRDILITWKKVLYIAGPAALGMLITPLSLGFITKIIAGFGEEAVAAFGVASRVEMFVLMVIASLGSVMIIFIGQNFSKKKFSRIFKSLTYSALFSMFWGVLVFIIFLFFSKAIASVFTDNAEVIEITRKFFLIVGASYGFQGLVMLGTASFNGINKPYPAAFMAIFRMLILYVPLAWIGSKLFAITGVFWAGFTANVVVGIISFMYLYRTLKKTEAKINRDSNE